MLLSAYQMLIADVRAAARSALRVPRALGRCCDCPGSRAVVD